MSLTFVPFSLGPGDNPGIATEIQLRPGGVQLFMPGVRFFVNIGLAEGRTRVDLAALRGTSSQRGKWI